LKVTLVGTGFPKPLNPTLDVVIKVFEWAAKEYVISPLTLRLKVICSLLSGDDNFKGSLTAPARGKRKLRWLFACGAMDVKRKRIINSLFFIANVGTLFIGAAYLPR